MKKKKETKRATKRANNMWKSKKGFIGLIVGLLLGFMIVTMLVTLLPGFVQMVDYGQSSAALNCVGYIDNDGDGMNLSYNASLGNKSTIGCLALKLYVPYLVLAILVGLIIKILYDRGQSAQQPSYY